MAWRNNVHMSNNAKEGPLRQKYITMKFRSSCKLLLHEKNDNIKGRGVTGGG